MRLREELPGLRAGPPGVSARVPGRLPCVLAAVRRTAPGQGRRQYVRELDKISKQALRSIALEPLDALARLALLEILEDRHARASTRCRSCRCSWHEVIGEPTIADAATRICDRIVHGAHRIDLEGDSICQPGDVTGIIGFDERTTTAALCTAAGCSAGDGPRWLSSVAARQSSGVRARAGGDVPNWRASSRHAGSDATAPVTSVLTFQP